MNSPIQWFLLLLCDRRTAPTLFSTLAWYPPVGGTRRIGKDSPVHRPDGLRPSRRRITACDQRFEGYPSMLACYIRRAVGTHEYLYYDSSGQRRAEPQLTGLGTSCAPVLFLSSQRNIPMRRKTHTQLSSQRNIPGNASQKGTPHSRCPRGDYVTRGHRQGGYIMFLFTTSASVLSVSSTSSCSSISDGNLQRPGLFAVLPCRFLHYQL